MVYKDPEKYKKYQKEYRIKNREKVEKYRKERGRILAKKRQLFYKLKVYNHYSNYDIKCICCGERHIEFLSVDHINNNGAKERRILKHGGGWNFYKWLIDNNYPEGYQILCMNCNFAKGIDPEHLCIHQKQIAIDILKNS